MSNLIEPLLLTCFPYDFGESEEKELEFNKIREELVSLIFLLSYLQHRAQTMISSDFNTF